VARGPAKRVAAAEAPRVYAPLRSTFALTIVNPSTIVLFAAFSAQLPSAASAAAIASAAFALFLIASGAAIAAFGVAGIVRLVLAS
jgi:threonine/homoserine/homoserine lactone efflux protein